MNFETIKCFICSTDFKTNRTFTLVSLGKERLWFCNRHIPKKKTLQHLSDADALSKLGQQKAHFHSRQRAPQRLRFIYKLVHENFGHQASKTSNLWESERNQTSS